MPNHRSVEAVVRRLDGEDVPLRTAELSPNFGDGLKDQAAAWA
jgi:hypothetical protein